VQEIFRNFPEFSPYTSISKH